MRIAFFAWESLHSIAAGGMTSSLPATPWVGGPMGA